MSVPHSDDVRLDVVQSEPFGTDLFNQITEAASQIQDASDLSVLFGCVILAVENLAKVQ